MLQVFAVYEPQCTKMVAWMTCGNYRVFSSTSVCVYLFFWQLRLPVWGFYAKKTNFMMLLLVCLFLKDEQQKLLQNSKPIIVQGKVYITSS